MKRLTILILTVLLLFSSIPAWADVLYVPEYADFYLEHEQDCTLLQRDYYANGENGYISLCRRPGAKAVDYLKNANRIHIYCTYSLDQTLWGLATWFDERSKEEEIWVKMEDLYLIYDGRAFREDHGDEIREECGNISGAKKVYYYDYPGQKSSSTLRDSEGSLYYSEVYTDPQGKRWGYIDYHYGVKNVWICIDAPSQRQESFGGDPNLERFESLQDSLKDITSEKTPIKEEGAVNLPKDPPRVEFDTVEWMIAGLVAGAVLLSVVLLCICYRKKK